MGGARGLPPSRCYWEDREGEGSEGEGSEGEGSPGEEATVALAGCGDDLSEVGKQEAAEKCGEAKVGLDAIKHCAPAPIMPRPNSGCPTPPLPATTPCAPPSVRLLALSVWCWMWQ